MVGVVTEVAVPMAYADIARRVLAAAPRLGPVRLVCVDGPAGSGKSTFAERLAAALGGAPVVHTDDLLAGWSDTLTFWPRLEEGVLRPLAGGRPGRYRRYDWLAGRFAEEHEVPVTPALVVEGVSAARAAVAGRCVLAVWVEAPSDLRLARGIARDGEALRGEWERWRAVEDAHFAADRTRDRADLLVDGAPGESPGPDVVATLPRYASQSTSAYAAPPDRRA